ncbi:Cytosolic endo-beta-N-acetylglucosaminidase [Trichostrongylus colubriformis]|uniref:Cytosolic endo-beta-N-acetylglucosaminidase n=1 Tax=Trichostrongylus colubriformis TaxID=6319 RepID=A0AAN8IEC3_TRICO
MVVVPIGGVDALWNWSPDSADSVDVKPLANFRDKLTEGKPETLICHDMKGGYLEEESDDGIIITEETPSPYVFLNWWNIDIFCYFSHNFVTIPPISYINLAHAHGCLAMGTFITESKGGARLCEQFLASTETVQRTVDSLVCVALHYKFDGWLINIENRILIKHIDNLRLFLRLLTDGMREAVGFSRVIWYDSVTITGMLKWQNMLNQLNRDWYECCDGIYLNYNWDDAMLLESADFGAINRIFVGIDCFARGCLGGWDCHRLFAKTNLMRMSVALFAPGWICEKFPDADPIKHGLRFWNKIVLYTPVRPILELPISTNFCAGFTREKEVMRFRLSSISLQPHFVRNSVQPMPTKEGGLLLSKGSCTRLFNFDVKCEGCRVRTRAQRDIGIVINDVVRETQKEGEDILVTIRKPIHLLTLDVYVDDEMDCLLYDMDILQMNIY